ncbi:hypothetical protein GWN26_09080 [Candidatus Saccharibacteria bacterium]|nr:hypothetical protein [Candidatus Saccharibacteria bacterium]NIS52955.1 hypothetical protein [Phycisphaerae bacterium]NIV72290.1 hypothetical protein [Calditrichia bacterium]NIV99272.1 hypothetical protein [Candidatus Saccharibacteria bacterium]
MNVPELHKLLVEAGRDIHIDTLYKARRCGYLSRQLALYCEKATGIPREKWTFPEKFGSAWDLPKSVVSRYKNRINAHAAM